MELNGSRSIGEFPYVYQKHLPWYSLIRFANLIIGGSDALWMEAKTRVLSLVTDHSPMLTAKEVEVLQFIAGGMSTKDVASKLDITTKAVDQRIARAASKLKANNRTHAVTEAIRLGVLTV